MEWKFARAVCETQYRGMHAVAMPFNLLTVPVRLLFLKGEEDTRKKVTSWIFSGLLAVMTLI